MADDARFAQRRSGRPTSKQVKENPVTRRTLLISLGATAAALARPSSADFWEKKPPEQWSAEEIDRLVSKSPWAKEVGAGYSPDKSGGGPWGEGAPTGQGGGMGRGGIRIPGMGGGGMGRRGSAPRGATSSYQAVVRWESAKPIMEAMKVALPEQFANHYVISISGIPLLGRKSDDGESSRRTEDEQFDDLKQLTTLQPKGKDAAQAGVVHRQVSAGTSFLFGFSREFFTLSAADKEVDFSSRFGQLTVKARFEPKEMLYHGELAV